MKKKEKKNNLSPFVSPSLPFPPRTALYVQYHHIGRAKKDESTWVTCILWSVKKRQHNNCHIARDFFFFYFPYTYFSLFSTYIFFHFSNFYKKKISTVYGHIFLFLNQFCWHWFSTWTQNQYILNKYLTSAHGNSNNCKVNKKKSCT